MGLEGNNEPGDPLCEQRLCHDNGHSHHHPPGVSLHPHANAECHESSSNPVQRFEEQIWRFEEGKEAVGEAPLQDASACSGRRGEKQEEDIVVVRVSHRFLLRN